jgi:hypothetical protein
MQPSAVMMPIRLAHHGHHHRHHQLGMAITRMDVSTTLNLSGQVYGQYQPVSTSGGRAQNLRGGGQVSPLGNAELTGQLHLPGAVSQGQVTGTITLTSPNGNVTLSLVGPMQSGSSPPPSTMQYTITGGTGAYANASGSGTVSFQEQQYPPQSCSSNGYCPPRAYGGTFTMTFQTSM